MFYCLSLVVTFATVAFSVALNGCSYLDPDNTEYNGCTIPHRRVPTDYHYLISDYEKGFKQGYWLKRWMLPEIS